MRLFVASYEGSITTLEFAQTASQGYSSDIIAQTTACCPIPSWITLDPARDILYATEAGVRSERSTGTLHTLSIQPDGSLLPLDSIPTPIGAAYAALYGDNQALAIAFYYAGSIGTYDVRDPRALKALQTVTFPPLSSPGPQPLQTQPRPHQIITDPTGQYMLVPDLGADLIRILRISHDAATLKQVTLQQQTLQFRRGSTPRHGVFVERGGKWYFHVVLQNINQLATFGVAYLADGSMEFEELAETDLLRRMDGSLIEGREGIKASHILVTPDQTHLILSLRNDSSYRIPSPIDLTTTLPADSLLTYALDPHPHLVSANPAGGSFPPHFSLNAAGDRVAVAVQTNGWVAIFERDVATGEMGRLLAVRDGLGEGGVVCVLWDREGR